MNSTCARCDKTIVWPFPSQPRKYCSRECRYADKRTRAGDGGVGAAALRHAYFVTGNNPSETPSKDDVRKLLWSSQEGECALCGLDIQLDFNAHLDHNKSNGRVRGLLCRRCNNGLGFFNDDPRLLRSAIQYLEREGRHW